MFRRMTKTAPQAGLALAAFLGALAASMPHAAAQDTQKPQTAVQDDDRSYLPPWMRSQSGSATQAGAQSPYANPAEDPKQRALALQQQQQKQRRRHIFPFDFSW
jgi:hypothetical protein